MIAIKEYI